MVEGFCRNGKREEARDGHKIEGVSGACGVRNLVLGRESKN